MDALKVRIPFDMRDEKRARSWWEALVIQRVAGNRPILAIRLSGPAILAEQEELLSHPSTIFHIESNPDTYQAMLEANETLSIHPDSHVILGDYHKIATDTILRHHKDHLIWLDADYTSTYKKHDKALGEHWRRIADFLRMFLIDEVFITQTFCRRRDCKTMRKSWWHQVLRNIFIERGYKYQANILDYGNAVGLTPMATALIHIKT